MKINRKTLYIAALGYLWMGGTENHPRTGCHSRFGENRLFQRDGLCETEKVYPCRKGD